VVQAHLPIEADEGNDHVQPLDAVEDVSDYWEDSPQPKHLHIFVQKPSGALQNISHSSLLTSPFVCPPLSANSYKPPICAAAAMSQQPSL